MMYSFIRAKYALFTLFILHFILTLTIIPPGLLFGNEPIATSDYALHFIRAVTTDQLLSDFHRIWGYNPFFMAGYPAGTVFDVNNHFIEVFIFLIHQFGISLPAAFNLFVFLAVLLLPALVWLTARNFSLSPWQQFSAVAIAMALWFADSQVRITWRIGVIASGVAMYSLPFSLSCLYRYCKERTKSWLLLLLISGSLISLLHPLSFLFFYIPVACYFLLRARNYDSRFWGALILFAFVVMLTNLFWISPLLQHLQLKTRSGYHWIGDLRTLMRDMLALRDSGIRFIIHLLAIVGVLSWWKNGQKEKALFFFFPALILDLSGYVAGETAFFRDMETYRNHLVASFLLVIPASVALSSGVSYLRDIPHRQRLIFACLLVLISLHLTGRNFLSLAPYFRGNFKQYALQSLGSDEMNVVKWLQANANPDHRIMVEYWPLGAMLPWYTGYQVIGGPYPIVWMPHNFANFASLNEAAVGGGVRIFGRDIREISVEESKSYTYAYNIGWIVVYTDESKEFFDSSSDIFPVADLGRYRIYQNRDMSSFFLKGKGDVRAENGSLHITEASGGELILKYHWSFSLITDPQQELEPYNILDDPVPFIKVPNNRFREFVIRDGSKPL